jgi:hypothetical protein
MSSFFKVRTVFLFVLLILSIFSYLPSVCGTWIKTEYNNQVNATDGSFFSLSTQQASYATGRGQIMYTTPGYEIISLIFGILIAIFIIKHKRKKK